MISLKKPYMLLSLALLSGLFMGCVNNFDMQNEPTQVGDYVITGVVSYTINQALSSYPISGTLSVFASQSPDTYYFLEKLIGFQELGYLASLENEKLPEGEKFKVGTATESTKYQYTTYFGYHYGGGIMRPNRIAIDRYANTNRTGLVTPVGEPISYSMPIIKHVSIVATR